MTRSGSAGGIKFGNGTNIRRGPDITCDSHGLGYPSHGINVHCYVYNVNGHGWVYLRDTTTGVSRRLGAARAALLAVRGSLGQIPHGSLRVVRCQPLDPGGHRRRVESRRGCEGYFANPDVAVLQQFVHMGLRLLLG